MEEKDITKIKKITGNLLDDANEDESTEITNTDNNQESNKTTTTATTTTIKQQTKNEIKTKPEIQKSTSSPLTSSANRQAYTLYDHAKCVDLQFSNIDLGYPTCPLLTKEDAEALLMFLFFVMRCFLLLLIILIIRD